MLFLVLRISHIQCHLFKIHIVKNKGHNSQCELQNVLPLKTMEGVIYAVFTHILMWYMLENSSRQVDEILTNITYKLQKSSAWKLSLSADFKACKFRLCIVIDFTAEYPQICRKSTTTDFKTNSLCSFS